MKQILVTGGAGYAGSVLVRQLLEKGYQVRVLDVLRYGGESLIGFFYNNKFELINGDIRI
jgi:nucleoside-diphosphate-sugar epimerase